MPKGESRAGKPRLGRGGGEGALGLQLWVRDREWLGFGDEDLAASRAG